MQQYEIKLARQSDGKAGNGHNKTSTVQVFCGNLIVKTFRFNVYESGSLKAAWDKANKYVIEALRTNPKE